MANRRVSVWKYVRVGEKWRYCRPAIGRNNKIKPHSVLVAGREEHHPEGHYYVHFLDGKKQVWKRVGDSPAEALKEAGFQEALLGAVNAGIAITPTSEIPLLVSYTIDPYLNEYKLSHRPESYVLMKQALYEFKGWCRHNIISRITRTDLLGYRQYLIDKGRTERTAGNKMLRVNQYIRAVQKLERGKGLVTVSDAKYVEREPEVYDQKELDAFFAKCNTFQTAVFKSLLMSGMRKQELESLTWKDVNFERGTIKIAAKPGFSPKTWEERTIEVPTPMIEILKELPRRGTYVFANGKGNKYTHMWDDCKAIADLAGLTGMHPHKFRATYATKLLQSGFDLKTVQRLLGHKSIESTMRYLARATSHEVRAKVDTIWK